MFQALIQRAGVALLVLVASTLCTISVSAQTPSGSITGRVTDSSGLPVPGATVTIQSTHLQGTRTAVTSENGDYLLPALPPGPYTDHRRTERLRHVETDARRRHRSAGQPRRHASARIAERSGERRGPCRRVHEHGAGVDEHPARSALDTPDGADAAVRGQPRAGRARDRTEQRGLDRRRDVVREPLHARRRADLGQHPRHALHALHRGRDSGDDGLDVWDLG